MKILGQHVARMYVLTIILFTILVAISSFGFGQIPYALIAAVIFTSIAEAAIVKFYMKQGAKIPFSAMITGFIIGAVAPINAPIILVFVASMIAVASKYFVKIKNTNIFNPAALGLLISLAIFGLGDQWWAATSYNIYGILVSFSLVFIISAYEAKRLVSGFSFVLVTFLVGILLAKPSGISIICMLTAF